MRKYIYIAFILTVFLLQGCDKNDTSIRVGKGTLLHNERVYQLYNAYERPPLEEKGATLDFEPYYSYFHALTLTGTDWGTNATIIIRSESDKLQSGEYHLQFWTIGSNVIYPTNHPGYSYPIAENKGNSIRMQIILADDYVHFAHNFNPGVKMRLSVTENRDIFDIELRYVECEGDFSIKYKGLMRNSW
ncbi:MAG: hypothetical protein LBI15_06365 [Dysgonamonadaceae bacterium]|jgi:hypothetical protein|nr:hypothetical protein [Dysgonamonadaceae bacterium]